MTVLVLQGDSNNNVLTHMSAALCEALKSRGVQAELYAPKSTGGVFGVFKKILETRASAVCSFGSGGGDWTTQSGESIYDACDCLFIGWNVDHPSYNVERLLTPIAKRVHISACEPHFRFGRAAGSSAVCKLMLPGVEVAADVAPLEERPLPLVAALSWIGEPKVWWSEAKGTPAYALVEGTVARALADTQVDLFAAFETTRAELGIEVPLNRAVCKLIADVGLFVRQYDRCKLVEALLASDIPWVLCGSGWRPWLGERRHLTYAESLDSLELAELYRQARVVVNINAANGASERVVMAMNAGAAVVSDYNSHLEDEFGHQGAISFYDRRGMTSLADVAGSLTDPKAAQGLADKGAAAVKRHAWSEKADEIIGLVQQSR